MNAGRDATAAALAALPALHRSEARLQSIFQQASVGLSEIAPDGRFIVANEALGRIVGRPAASLAGMRVLDVTHPDDAEATLRATVDVMADGRERTLEKRYLRPDGGFVVAQSSVVRLGDGSADDPHRLLAVTIDLSRQREAEAALREREAQKVDEERRARELLEQRVVERTQVLRQLLLHLESVQDEERRRIARELHDGLGQVLSSVTLSVSALRQSGLPLDVRGKVDRLHHLMQHLDRELDRVVFSLRPTALDDCGLAEGVASHVQTWSELSGVAVDFVPHGLDGRRLPSAVEAAAFRVIQEALNNVSKHAGATRVSLLLELRQGALRGSLEDDGVGFDPAAAGEARAAAVPAWGLLGMHERIEALGGQLSVESSPGGGTTVLWRVPVA